MMGPASGLWLATLGSSALTAFPTSCMSTQQTMWSDADAAQQERHRDHVCQVSIHVKQHHPGLVTLQAGAGHTVQEQGCEMHTLPAGPHAAISRWLHLRMQALCVWVSLLGQQPQGPSWHSPGKQWSVSSSRQPCAAPGVLRVPQQWRPPRGQLHCSSWLPDCCCC
jgi:hypothetical protein